MAQHNFNNRDMEQYRSANAYRDEAERRERERDEARRRKEAKEERQNAYKEERRIVERHLRSEIRDDKIAKEIYEGNNAPKFIVGMAMLVASVAAESSYNKLIMDAQTDYKKDYDAETKRRTEEIKESRGSSLAEYGASVEKDRETLEATQQSHYVVYSEAKKEAQIVIDAANKEYEKESLKLKQEEKRLDDVYKEKMDYANERLSLLQRRSEFEAWEINNEYKFEVDRINKECPVDERGLGPNAAERDRRLIEAREQRDAAMDASQKKYDEKIDSTYDIIDKMSKHHTDEINAIHDKMIDAETKRDYVVTRQNDVVRAEQINYVNAVREAKSELTNAEARKDIMQNFFDTKDENGLTGVDRAAKIGTDNSFEKYSVVVDKADVGSAAEQFRASVDKSHSRLGNDLACVFGSKEEVDLINRVNADKKAMAEAKKNGVEPTVRLATKEDYDAVKKIETKYAGDMSSMKGLDASIKTLKSSINALNEKQNELSTKIAAKNGEIAKIDAKMSSVQNKINELAADKKMLTTGRNSDGSKLTAEQKSKIEARIKANGDMKENRKQLMDLKMQKNAAQNDLNGLTIQSNRNKAMIDGAKTHVAQLEKNGKAIVLADQRANALSERAFKMMSESAGMMKRSVNRATLKGNIFYEAKERKLMNMRKAAQRYELSVKYSKKVMTFMRAGSGYIKNSMGKGIKVIGKNTRLGKAISARYQAMRAKFMQSKFGKKVQSGLEKLQKGKSAVGRFGKKAADLNLKILKGPGDFKKFKQDLTKKAFRTVRKEVGKVTGKIKSKAGTAVKNQLMKSKLYRKMSERSNLIKERIKLGKDRVASFLQRINPFKKLKGVASKFVSMITSALSSIGSFFLTILSYVIGFLLVGVIVIVLALICVSLLTALLTAIANFFKELSGTHRALVKNNPAYIANQAVNYRSEELNIFSLFLNANNNKANGCVSNIEVSKEPIYYSLYYKPDLADKIFNFFGIETAEERKITSMNLNALDAWGSVTNQYNVVSNTVSFATGTDNLKYGSAKLSYYTSNDLIYDSQGNYKLKPDAVASNYEISNAKDVMAMVDALYTHKEDGMQKMEVLSYLGVGDYQIGYSDGAEEPTPTKVANNLFWETHKLIYNEGNKATDIKFCPIKNVEGTLDYKIDCSNNGSSYDTNYICNDCSDHGGACSNSVVCSYTIERTPTIEVCPGHMNYCIDLSECTNITQATNPATGLVHTVCGGHTYYHSKSPNYLGDVILSDICPNCTPTTGQAIQLTGTFEVCRGHIDLDVSIVVTLLSDGEQMFQQAAKIPGVEDDTYVLTSLFPLALVSFDEDNGVWHFGGLFKHQAYRPAEDWAQGSKYRDLAIVKSDNDANYYLEDIESADDVNNMSIELKHYDGNKMQSLAMSYDKHLLYGVFVGSNRYYIKSLISGEQKGLEYYLANQNGTYGPIMQAVSFAVSRGESLPYIY